MIADNSFRHELVLGSMLCKSKAAIIIEETSATEREERPKLCSLLGSLKLQHNFNETTGENVTALDTAGCTFWKEIALTSEHTFPCTYVHGNVCSLVRAISFQNVHPAVSSAVTFSPVVSLKLCCNLREPRRLQSFGLSSLSVALVSSMIIAALLLHSIDPKTNSCLNELSAIKFPPIHSFLQVIHFLLSPYQPEKEERVS